MLETVAWDMLKRSAKLAFHSAIFWASLCSLWIACESACISVDCVGRAAWRPSADEAARPQARKLLLRGKYAEAADLYSPLAAKNARGSRRAGPMSGGAGQGRRGRQGAGRRRRPPCRRAGRAGRDGLCSREVRGRAESGPNAGDSVSTATSCWPDGSSPNWTERPAGSTRPSAATTGWSNYYNDHDEMSAESLRWIGLGAAQWARWNRLADQFQFLVHDLYPDALKDDPDYWPAHYEAGMLFLEKHNRADAAREFQAALEINPNAAEVHLGLALAWVEQRRIEKAEASLARALEINPRLLDGWLLKADLLWANFQVPEALALLQQKALPLNPICEETLGRVAACYLLLDKKSAQISQACRASDAAESPCRRVLLRAGRSNCRIATSKRRPKRTSARRFASCRGKSVRRPISACSTWPPGREEEARRALRTAFAADPFNVRVKNSLEVLDVLGAMQTLDSGAFCDQVQRRVRQAAGPLCRPARGSSAAETVPAIRLYAARQDVDRDLQSLRAGSTAISGSAHGWWACRTSARSPPAPGTSWRWLRPPIPRPAIG